MVLKFKIPLLESAKDYRVWNRIVELNLTGLGPQIWIKAATSTRTAAQQQKDAKPLFVILNFKYEDKGIGP